jgi:hypothetical protein
VDDPALYDPYGEKQKKDHYIFDLEKDSETLKYRFARRDAMILKSMNNVHNLSTFCSTMQDMDKEHFLWLDIFIAAEFKIPSKETSNSEIVSSNNIWNDFLKVLMI